MELLSAQQQQRRRQSLCSFFILILSSFVDYSNVIVLLTLFSCDSTTSTNAYSYSVVSNKRSAAVMNDGDSYDVDFLSRECVYGGDIVISHPSSLRTSNKQYDISTGMLHAAQMTIDKINSYPKCGITIQEKNYSVSLHTYGDESDPVLTKIIGKQIIIEHNTTTFLTAGYSSDLTRMLTPTANDFKKICITAGSAQTAVYQGNDFIFGLLPPSSQFLEKAFIATKRKGAQTVAYVTEEGVGTCVGAPIMSERYNISLVAEITIPELSPIETFEEVAYNMSLLNPDVLISCVRSSYSMLNQGMRNVNWVPKAMIYTIIFASPEFEKELQTDLSYIMGISAWDRALPPIPDVATGWTPYDFDVEFEKKAFRRPVYQYTAQSAAMSIFAQAVERVNTLKTDVVRDYIATNHFSTVYGNISFDSNGQSAAPFLLLQYDKNQKLHVLLPDDLKGDDPFNMVYPLPTWATRDCLAMSKCLETNGTCAWSRNNNVDDTDIDIVDGSCICPETMLSTGMGPTAECIMKSEQYITSINYGLAVALPLIISVLVVAIVFVYYHHLKVQHDSLWKVNKSELKFDDPPQIVGCGTFGEVLLAEYRGTQVAVKRVIPSKLKTKETTASGTGSNDDDDEEEEETENNEINIGIASSFRKMGSASWGGISGTTASLMEGGAATASISRSRSHSGTKKYNSGGKKPSTRKLRQNFIAEMKYVSKLRHPCVTTVMGAVISPGEDPMLIMEYMEKGSLYDLLHNETVILEGELLLPMLQDVTQGCRFLHAATPSVIHGDLKAANILVDSKFRAKVCDFGLSQKKQCGATGSPYWMAPELLRGESVNTKASDVYSFGIILYEAYSRKDPYDGEDPRVVLSQIVDPSFNRRPILPPDCPAQLASIMSDCLVPCPAQRPTFEEVDTRLKRVDIGAADSANNSSHLSGFLNKTTVSLFDIFPKHIAEALRDGKKVEAEHKDCVTIFFSDIVGFTDISSTLDPRKVANLLDRLYQKFDRLSHKHDIFKVETIGDAYMAVTNLVKDQPDDHAKRIAEFAVEAMEEANQTPIDVDDPDKGYIDIRIGFHSGPVVADVVGSRNPRYCLFGDTVNTASRMESTSARNRVHCSKAAAELVKKQNCKYTLIPRGKITVKGKGEMETFWVKSGRESMFITGHKLASFGST